MSRSAKHFEEFQPHSKHKHLILENYFLAWGHKLGLRVGAGNRIVYVDACAGRGTDDIGNEGSPLIAARAAAVAQASITATRATAFTIQVVAVETNRNHYLALSRLLAPFSPSVRVLQGTLREHIVELEAESSDTPTLYFIDPFGLEPLDAELVRRALAGRQHEALLLFADQAALRHFGAITAEETRAERVHRKAVSPLPLFPDLEVPNASALAAAAAESRAALEITRESAIRIMNRAFGDEKWLAPLERAPPYERRELLLSAYGDRLRAWGATRILHIPIVDQSGTRAYTLVHASKSAKAFSAMKEAVGYALGNSPLPVNVVEQMRDLVRCEIDDVAAAVRNRFAGETVRWAEDRRNRRAACVRNFVLEETPMFPFEMDSLKERLAEYREPGRVLVYSFPED